MTPPPARLPDPLRWSFDTLPFLNSRSMMLCYDPEGRILECTSDNPMGLNITPDIWGKFRINELFIPTYNVREKRFPLEAFLRNKDTLLRINILTDPETRAVLGAGPSSFVYGIPALMRYRPVEGFFVALIHPLAYSVEHALGFFSQDLLALLGPDDEILIYTELFNRVLRATGETGEVLFMRDLTDPDKWDELVYRKERTLDLFHSGEKESAAQPWAVALDLPAFLPTHWIVENPELCRFQDGALLVGDSARRNIFFTCMEAVEHSTNDIRIEFDADLTGFFGAGVCFHTNIYKTQSDIGFLDGEGYNLQLLNQEGGEVSFRVKKFGQMVDSIKLNLPDLLAMAAPDPRTARLCFEKNAFGLFHAYINGALLGTLSDVTPILGSKNQFFSIIGGRNTCYRNLRVRTRPCALDPAAVPPEAVDLRLNNMADTVFEARIGVISGHSGLDGMRYVHLKDVTASRELLARVNRYVKEIDDDLNTARRIQSHLTRLILPDTPRLRFSYFYRPSGKVGGDMLDIRDLGQGRFALLVFDVAGHGIAASLISSMARMLFNTAFRQTASPAETLNRVNRDICAAMEPSMFLTAVLCVIDVNANTLSYARAGHCPPALFSVSRPLPELLENGGPVLGNSPAFVFEEYAVSVRPGDRLLMYTDGVIEIRNRQDQFFERRRLFDHIRESLALPVDQVKAQFLKAATAFNGSGKFDDDMTMILADIL